ncbi:hypothetical protein GDO78_004926 [Eleutherodactylus coqui]|uniref:Uncharacterized protein n=1 Tax=Eleutherodactylus coqui TaxID=57060 RepID=A0A8J6FIJ4_ELECQ|nr:hypothetical protein GDO78_004926 [Eleutherodactylus coqui]
MICIPDVTPRCHEEPLNCYYNMLDPHGRGLWFSRIMEGGGMDLTSGRWSAKYGYLMHMSSFACPMFLSPRSSSANFHNCCLHREF